MSGNSAVTEESRRVVLAMYAAAAKSDVQGLMSFMHEDIVVHEPPFLPYGGVQKGVTGFQNIFVGISPYADPMKMKLDHMVADGERVFCVITIPDKKTGKHLMLAEESLVRDGKIVEIRVFYFDAGSMLGAKA